MLDNIQLVVTVVVCFASLSHFYSSKPSGQGVARSLWPKHPLQAVLPHSCHGRKAADVDLWGLGRRSWPQNGRGPKIKAKKSCVRMLFFCCEMSGTKSVGRSIPLRSGCAQVGLFFTMTCTTLTSRTCFYFLGWCFRRASLDLDQFCQHLEDASWLTGMHQRFDNNCFWKSQDA